jgi:hypothetical protein
MLLENHTLENYIGIPVMEQPTVTMELGERIDVAEILSLKYALEIIPSLKVAMVSMACWLMSWQRSGCLDPQHY